MIWGVDSAGRVTEALYQCVVKKYGKPLFWGRYLTDVPNVSDGLTKQEITFLHQKGVKVLPIYNVFREATGYREGTVMAANAIFRMQFLGFPKGMFAFGNVERFFQVDEEWIRGWVDRFYTSGYRPGLYHDPVTGGFSQAYCQAAANNEKVQSQLVLWSAEPEVGPSGPRNAPVWKPVSPACKANVWAWQYARDEETCHVDTNLMDRKLYAAIW